ncbi:MAG: AAA family ATPase [Pseudomonadota bacterium]
MTNPFFDVVCAGDDHYPDDLSFSCHHDDAFDDDEADMTAEAKPPRSAKRTDTAAEAAATAAERDAARETAAETDSVADLQAAIAAHIAETQATLDDPLADDPAPDDAAPTSGGHGRGKGKGHGKGRTRAGKRLADADADAEHAPRQASEDALGDGPGEGPGAALADEPADEPQSKGRPAAEAKAEPKPQPEPAPKPERAPARAETDDSERRPMTRTPRRYTRPRQIRACTHVKRRGQDDVDRKIAALSPLWEGLSLPDMPDPDAFQARLDSIAPLMAPFNAWLSDELALQRAVDAPCFRPPPILLYGPPGTGKTYLARTIAAAMGVSMRLVGLGGSSDARTLLGTSAGYGTGAATLPAIVMAESKIASPVIILDELDKVSKDSNNGAWTDGVLSFLEPTSASTLFDEFLLTSVDVSNVVWIATANDLGRVPAPLISRFACFEVQTPSAGDRDALLDLAARAVTTELGLERGQAALLADPALRAELELPRNASIRDAKGALRRALAAQIRRGPRH